MLVIGLFVFIEHGDRTRAVALWMHAHVPLAIGAIGHFLDVLNTVTVEAIGQRDLLFE